jgi:hypothetical protein
MGRGTHTKLIAGISPGFEKSPLPVASDWLGSTNATFQTSIFFPLREEITYFSQRFTLLVD